MKWSRNIAVSIIMLYAPLAVYAVDPATTAGNDSAKSALSLYGTPAGIKTNLGAPLTDKNTPMSTVDGSKTFSTKLGSNATNSFLTLFLQPSATGDIRNVIITQDIDMDGVTDYIYNVPQIISGVCSNGYYSCDPGTWVNCKPYKWVSDSQGHVSSSDAAVPDLGACYCSNSSCGSQLVWSNTDIILKGLGGGLVSAVQNANFNFTVSNISMDAVSITYYGRQAAGGNTSSTASMMLAPPVATNDYYNSQTAMSNAVGGAVSVSALSPDSLYSQVMASPAASSGSSLQSCKVRANVTVTSDLGSLFFNNETLPVVADHFLYARILQVDSNNFKIQIANVGKLGNIGSLCDPTNPFSTWYTLKDISIPVAKFNVTAAQMTISKMVGSMCRPDEPSWLPWSATLPGAICAPGQWPDGQGCNGDGVAFLDAVVSGFGSTTTANIACPGSNLQYPSLTWNGYFEYAFDTVTESVDNQCQALESKQDCTLYNETVDSVLTKSNGTSTGLTPLPSSKSFTGSTGEHVVTRDWWLKERTYACKSSTPWDFSSAQTRFGSVKGSFGVANNEVSYTDKTMNSDGTWSTSAGTISVPDTPPVPKCELGCKTKAPHEDNQVTTTGLNSTLRTKTTGAIDYIYKTCVDSVCPLDRTGETIVLDCQCMDNFNEAATAVQLMRLAGKDTKCTSGRQVPLLK